MVHLFSTFALRKTANRNNGLFHFEIALYA